MEQVYYVWPANARSPFLLRQTQSYSLQIGLSQLDDLSTTLIWNYTADNFTQ